MFTSIVNRIHPSFLLPVLAVGTVFFSAQAVSAGEQNDTITFALVGDIMLGTDYPDSVRNIPAYEGEDLFRSSRPVISAADVAIGNLEGPITVADSCVKTLKDSVAISFRMPPVLARRLSEAGFDVLSTANNHANDFGKPGRRETESILDSLGIAHTGRIGDIASLTVKGSRIAVIGFSVNQGSHSLLDIGRAAMLVGSVSETHEIVVVTFHGGAEGAEYTHTPDGEEWFLEENRGDIKRFARAVVDAGADIVFGHGPHVPRGVELYKNRIIAYSLGNFCTWFGVNVRGVNGFAPLLWVETGLDGTLTRMKIISFEQQSRHYPLPDPLRRAEKLMIELSLSDFGSFPFDYHESE